MALVEATKSPVSDRDSRPYSLLSVKNVLFATDFSPTSEAALPYAAAICRRFGSTLHTVHVLSDASLMMMTRRRRLRQHGHHLRRCARRSQAAPRSDIGARRRHFPSQLRPALGRSGRSLCGLIHENDVDLAGGWHSRAHGLGKAAAWFRGRGYFAAFCPARFSPLVQKFLDAPSCPSSPPPADAILLRPNWSCARSCLPPISPATQLSPPRTRPRSPSSFMPA